MLVDTQSSNCAFLFAIGAHCPVIQHAELCGIAHAYWVPIGFWAARHLTGSPNVYGFRRNINTLFPKKKYVFMLSGNF
jgi:hypothetical protein